VRTKALAMTTLFTIFSGTPVSLSAHQLIQPQIPTLQVCNNTEVTGGPAVVTIASLGNFSASVRLSCLPPGNPYPMGLLTISFHMNDPSNVTISGNIRSSTFEQVTTTRRFSPTVFANGRCMGETGSGPIIGCRFWLMIADNKRRTPEVISFLVFNGVGRRVAYGTSCVTGGTAISVAPTPN
jgi:hypothetical protein